MTLHIYGIGGTFMGSLAALALELNFQVTGSDKPLYPPMSTQLAALKIPVSEGYEAHPEHFEADCLVIGNVMCRGMPAIEALLNENRSFLSGPEWLAKYVLQGRHVLAVSGTHGKTTTASMLAWILEEAGLNPGFLIGGVPNNFDVSARLGKSPFFVVEADEYDSAFFDKRSKFIHYRPNTLIINNIEFDHADIFPDLFAIQTQFHHLLRTIPENGLVITPNSEEVEAVIRRGCWTKRQKFSAEEAKKATEKNVEWQAKNANNAGSSFEVWLKNTYVGKVSWDLIGTHNINNALAAIAASYHVGVPIEKAITALNTFKGVKRRLEVLTCLHGVTIYDDFAHHPTAIKTTLQGLREKVGNHARIIVALDLRSNTMRAGHHEESLKNSFGLADKVFFYKANDISWDVEKTWQATTKPGGVFTDIHSLSCALAQNTQPNDHVVFMSNGGFADVYTKFVSKLSY